jgi:hypothetical protein
VERIDVPGAETVEASSAVVASVGRKFEPKLGPDAEESRYVTAITVGQLAGKCLQEITTASVKQQQPSTNC